MPIPEDHSRFQADPVKRKQLAASMRDWLAKKRFPYFVTLIYENAFPSIGAANRDLKHWDAMVNRATLGAGWLKKPDERMNAVWVPESIETNPHWHGLVLTDLDHLAFQHAADYAWRSIAPGNALVEMNRDPEAVAAYLTKQITRPTSFDSAVIALGVLDRW